MKYKTYFFIEPYSKNLTGMVSVKEEGTLELEVEVFGDGLHQVIHAESVHDGEPILGVGLPLVHEQGALHLRLLPVPLGPAELVERHLA